MPISGEFPQQYLGLALIDVPLSTAVANAQVWFKPSEQSRAALEIPAMEPYAYRPNWSYGYFWSPLCKPEATALVANACIAHNLARSFGHRVIEIRVSSASDKWPICEFKLSEGGVERRFIRAFRNDTKWDFYENGEPLPFEDLNQHRNRRVRSRLTPKMLKEYCLALGWNIEPQVLLASAEPATTLIRQWAIKPSSASQTG